MPLESGVRLGPYEIVSLISAEGDEIYKASDTQQNLTVAIKLLPPDLSEDDEWKQRVERQLKALSGLSHPHIRTVHSISQEGDTHFLVMEHLEGETLAERLQRGPLPLDEAVKVALGLADGLNRMHGAGLVHRDLRPANVILTAQGPKLTDFGLGKQQEEPKKPVPSSDVRSKATLPDVPDDIVRYMPPERVEGREGDARSDIFAFGAVLYEMVTGEKAFEGRNRPMLIAAIASLDPYPMSKNQPDSSPMLDHIAQRCIAKDPDDRWQSAHDLLVQLRWVAEGGDVLLAAARERRKRERRVLAVVGLVVFFVTVAVTQAFMYWGGTDESEPFQFRVPVAGLSSSDISISPDGSMLAVVAKPNTQEPSWLFVRQTGTTEFRRLVGTEEASQPFWSPDSKSIGFIAGGRVKRVDAAGGAPKDLGEAKGFTGGSWGTSGIILFGSAKGVYRISSEGGPVELVTTLEKEETGHFWPSFLPDGRHYLYTAWSADVANRAVFGGTLDEKETTKVLTADSNVAYAEPGYLLFRREATLFALPFDAGSVKSTGEPLHIADQLDFTSANGRGHFGVSQNGTLLYFQGQGGRGGSQGRGEMIGPNFQWGWRDRTGAELERIGETGTFGDMDLSPDGKLVAVTQPDTAAPGADIYVIDWQRLGVASRLTLDPGDDINPVWARPAGDRIAFTTYRKGNADIYVKNANGSGAETPLLETPENESVEAWSHDGQYIAYKRGPERSEDIWILPLTGEKKEPFPIVEGPFQKDEPQFSYDGKWLAYTSNESGGIYQVWLVSVPGREQRLQVSKDGGGQPRWRADGKELFFRSPDGSAMSAEITLGPKVGAGVPGVLFGGGALTTAISGDPVRHQWAVMGNGQRFVTRVTPAVGGAQARGAVTVRGIPFNAPTTRGGQGQALGGQAIVSSGLTVIRNWPASFKKETP